MPDIGKMGSNRKGGDNGRQVGNRGSGDGRSMENG